MGEREGGERRKGLRVKLSQELSKTSPPCDCDRRSHL